MYTVSNTSKYVIQYMYVYIYIVYIILPCWIQLRRQVSFGVNIKGERKGRVLRANRKASESGTVAPTL